MKILILTFIVLFTSCKPNTEVAGYTLKSKRGLMKMKVLHKTNKTLLTLNK